MIEQSSGSSLDPSSLLELYQITQDELSLIREFAGVTTGGMISEVVRGFYVWLRTQPEYDEFFSDILQRRVRC